MKAKLRQSLVFLSLFLMVILFANGSIWAAQELVILHTNDVHGRLESHTPSGASNEQGGLIRLASLVEDIRDRYGNQVLLLDAGDHLHGTNITNLFGGRPSLEVMNALGYDAMTLGNHEFNYGQEAVKELMTMANFPMLAGNVFYPDGSVYGYSALVKEVNGLKVGVIGVVAQDTPLVTHPKNVVGLRFANPITEGRRLARELRPDVDILIGLTHIGYGVDRELALAAPEFDIIVGGHSHTKLGTAQDIGGVLMVQDNEYANYLGYLKITVEDGKIISYEQELIPVTHETPKHEKVEKIVTGWQRLLEKEMGKEIGSVDVVLDGERGNIRTGDTNLANLVADVMKQSVGADIAVTNGGGIRASINPGKITVGDIYTVLPFDNTLVFLEVTGEQIQAILEHSVRLYPEQNGGFLQVSGLTVVFNPHAPAGQRITDVKVNGVALDKKATYTVATNDFLAAGGDGYEVLQNSKLLADTGIALRDVMVAAFQAGSVAIPPAGRITPTK